ARLAEELAPRLLAGDDVPDEGVDLLLRAVGCDGGCGEQEAEAAGGAQGAELGDRLLDGHAVGPVQALAVGVRGQVGRRPAGEAEALPPLADGEIRIPVLLEPGPALLDDVGRRLHFGVAHVVPLGRARARAVTARATREA